MIESMIPRLARGVIVGLCLCAGAVGIAGGAPATAAEKLPALKLIELAGQDVNAPAFREALVATLGEERIRKGTAVIAQGADFLFAVESEAPPTLFVDDAERPAMQRIRDTNLWVARDKLRTGWSHRFHYMAGGNRLGGGMDVPAYGPDSYQQPGVQEGTLSPMLVHTSKIYDGMESNYWVYVPAQYNAQTPAAVMVWQDGGGHIDRNGGARTLNVIDNLTHQKKIPVMIQVFIQPGDINKAVGTPTHEFVSNFSKRTGRTLRDSMRSTQYDTVTDRYARYLRDEILAEVGAKYSLRKDGYSRGIAGDSSGAIAAFNAAWQQPELFSRVLSRIGTYTSIQWQPGVLDGGNIFPFAVRKEPKRNIRVWLSDGSEDLENDHGSWPLQNIQMANSLKMREYDYYFRFGNAAHNGAQGAAEAPEALAWLWRDYDPAKTEQTYVMDPAEKTKPYYRVQISNRE